MRRSTGFTLLELAVAVAILAILGALSAAVVVDQIRKTEMARTRMEIGSIGSVAELYRGALGAYPPDTVPGEPEAGSNEALVYWLTREHRRGMNTYGPYLGAKQVLLADTDGDGFPEYRDPFGNLYLYAENASQTAKNEREGVANPEVGANPRGFDVVSAGRDGLLGGTISPETGFVEDAAKDANGDGAPDGRDDVLSWRLGR
jgi:prepilin-type N-terminal cleavage/methylation domain-containing protein